MPNPRNNELRFDITGAVIQSTPEKTAKRYEILCIHTGKANDLNFSTEVLQESVKFFESIECFTDHNMFGESAHYLVGVLPPVEMIPSRAIFSDLRPTGPAAELFRTYKVLIAPIKAGVKQE